MNIPSNLEWQKWGKEDPLYGVSTLPGYDKNGAKPWTHEEFYRYGQLCWSEFAEHWERYGCIKTSVVEIGCGAGRLTRQLAEQFSVVHAIDVSQDMISMARQHIMKDNVQFHLTNGLSIPLPDNSVTAAISIDVFQHFDNPSIASKYFSEMYRILCQDGTFMVHLPIYLWPRISHPRLDRALKFILRKSYRLLRVADRIQAIRKRRAIRLGYGQGFIYHLPYDGNWVFQCLAELGFVDLEIHLFAHSGQGWHDIPAVRPYVFGRKSLASSRRQLQFL